MHTHSCIKCGIQYNDGDPEPYYCATCTDEKKRIAAEIDAKMANIPREKTLSALEEYDQAQKVHGFLHVRL